MASKNISLVPSSVVFSGDARYLTKLSVFGQGDGLSQSAITEGFEVRAGNIGQHDQTIHNKIKVALKLLALRKPHVLVQFWSPRVLGKHRQLTTKDQPFGLGVNNHQRLISYRRDSECKNYDVDKDYNEEEDISPLVRVFRQGSPEWSSDVTNYLPKYFPQQECAIRCSLQEYLALPVFDPNTRLCVGVLELLTSSMNTSFYYEVQQIQEALKKQDLTYQQVSGGPAANIEHEGRQNELNKIFSILKVVCDTHRLPLAQTWAISPSASVASHEHVLTKTCNRYDSRCLGKVCMSTVALPFYVPDLGVWHFRDACKEQHLERSRGLVGMALLSHGSCFCVDVTKLGQDDYPLVHHASKWGLTSCFAIYCHSVETNVGYVLEFFLPSRIEDSRSMLNLVQMMKHKIIEIASGFERDDNSPIQVIGPQMDLYVNIEPHIIQTSSSTNNYLKQGTKRKRGSDKKNVLVTVTYGEDIRRFRFPISLGLLKLKYKVAKKFKLKVKMIRLKYTDEENDLITICVDDDLNLAMVASGSKNSMNLICKLSAD